MDPLFNKPFGGTISNGRHREIRWHAGKHSGDTFVQNDGYDGLALTIEVADTDDAEAMINAIAAIGSPRTIDDLAATFIATRPDLEPMSLDEWVQAHAHRLGILEVKVANAIIELWMAKQ